MGLRADRGDRLKAALTDRLEADLKAALRRKPPHEGRLGGVIRALLPYSPRLRAAAGEALTVLVRRGSFKRPLYAALGRGLAEVGESSALAALRDALGSEEAGGLCTLSAASLSRGELLSEPLARAVMNRHPHLAFAAEVARVARGESSGDLVASVAPKIKESHRIDLCAELFVPLLWAPPMPAGIGPALGVLRDAERHLGRWLVFGAIAARGGDRAPLDDARQRASAGPSSARSAWAMVAWALTEDVERPPDVRPTLELVARLSDRPSADRDPTFLYRLAAARATNARPMLETLAKSQTLTSESAVRAALYLARDHGRDDMTEALRKIAGNPRREALRGLATAALYDVGERGEAAALGERLLASKQLATVAWGALVHAHGGDTAPLLDEPRFRRVQLGWPE